VIKNDFLASDYLFFLVLYEKLFHQALRQNLF
jgi:hypothetical protein